MLAVSAVLLLKIFKSERSTVMRYILEILKDKKLLVISYILAGIGVALLNAFGARYFQKVLDNFGAHTLNTRTIMIYGTVLALTYIISYLDEYPSRKLSQGIYLDFKIKAMKKISVMEYKSYEGLGMGNLVQRIENGADAGKQIVFDFYFEVFRNLVPTVIFSLIFIANIDKSVMIYILIGYVFVFIVTNILLKYLYKIKERILNNEEIFNRYLIRGFMELVVFRIHKKFEKEIQNTEQVAADIVKAKTKVGMIHEAFFAIFALFIALIQVIIIYISWNNDTLSIGSLVAILSLVDKAYGPIAIFNVLFVQYKLDTSAFSRYVDFLNMPEDYRLNSGRLVREIKGGISLENITVSYEGKKVLKDIFLDIPKGTSVAFVGESGAGKSTVVKEIMGLLKPDSGNIYIDQENLDHLNLNSLYDHISYIPQEPPIFDGTLRENLIFDKVIPDEEIIKVIDKVELREFYEKLPKGLDTEVGERGIMLSGGERQRIAIGRLYFLESKIIILDEATSAMDNVTEEVVIKKLMTFLKNRTIITIAHRLNTIKKADKVYVFKDGTIAEEGTFQELLSYDSYFRQLWDVALEV